MFGTVQESRLTESFPIPTRGDKTLHRRQIIIRPLSMELQRMMSNLAQLWDKRGVGINVRFGGIIFSTRPSQGGWRKLFIVL